MDMSKVKQMKLNGKSNFDFGLNLQAIRKKKGITQNQLAEKMGVTLRTITYYEGEATNPSLKFIEEAAGALEVSKTVLMNKDGKISPVQEAIPVIRPLKLRITKIPQLPKKDQESIVALLDGLFAKNRISINK